MLYRLFENDPTKRAVDVSSIFLASAFSKDAVVTAKACPEAAMWLMERNSVEQSDAKQEAIDAKLAEAQAQLERYSKAENIANIPNLHRAAVVFSGTELKGLKVL